MYVKVAVKNQVLAHQMESKETKTKGSTMGPSPAQSLATLKTLIAKAAAGTLNTRKSPSSNQSVSSSNRSSLSPGLQSKQAGARVSSSASSSTSSQDSPQNQRSSSSLSSNSCSTQASYEEPAKSLIQDNQKSDSNKSRGVERVAEPEKAISRKMKDTEMVTEPEKAIPSPLPPAVTSTSTGTEPMEKQTSTDNDYWQEEKVKMENAHSYQSFQKGSILKKSLTSKGTSPPPQTISTQVSAI